MAETQIALQADAIAPAGILTPADQLGRAIKAIG
jgi:hypothetical protein